jgi:hypothetical protein
MKKILFVVAIIAAVAIVMRVVDETKRARQWLEDPRWQDAVDNYRKARERNAPQVEIEQRKREIGELVRQLRAEQAKA